MDFPDEVRRDHFAMSYGLATVAYMLLLAASEELDMAFNLWLLLVPILFLPAIIILVWFAIALAVSLFRRRWRRVISILVGPPIAVAIVLLPASVGIDATWLRFEVTKSRYLLDLQEHPAVSPRFKVWRWGETGGVSTASSFYTLVYDDNDKTATTTRLPSDSGNKGSPSVLSGAVAQGDQAPLVSVRQLHDHFYLVTEIYE